MKKTMLIIAAFLLNTISVERDCFAMNIPNGLSNNDSDSSNKQSVTCSENLEGKKFKHNEEKVKALFGEEFVDANYVSSEAVKLSLDEVEAFKKIFGDNDVSSTLFHDENDTAEQLRIVRILLGEENTKKIFGSVNSLEEKAEIN